LRYAFVTLLFVFLLACSRRPAGEPAPPVDESQVTGGPHARVLVSEPLALMALEARGFRLSDLLGAAGATNADLARSPTYRDLVRTLRADLRELDARPGVGGKGAHSFPFDPAWLTEADARFELTGFVPRLDRAFVESGTCGELRLVYRLALTQGGRSSTRLPMTLSLNFVPRGDAAACASLAKELLALPERGGARVAAIASLLRTQASAARRIEVNLQNLHGPALANGLEDHAEYLLRSFDVTESGLSVRPLLDTPRTDLSAGDRAELAAFLRDHFADIDRGTVVVPAKFLASRALSVSPRGLARPRNRPFATLFAADADALFANLPYASARLARSPRALLRRLDEASCPGCHQSRAVAGFHLLGEEREAHATSGLAVGYSNHLAGELPWREAFLDALAAGRAYAEPRPLAERATLGSGTYGERCGLGDAGFAALGCGAGLACRDELFDELGACTHAQENREGDACERSRVEVGQGAEGDHLLPEPRQACAVEGGGGRGACASARNGFPGGACTEPCDRPGEVRGEAVCLDVPRADFEEACFAPGVPFEPCLRAHENRERLRACDAATPCRDDYTCARVPGAPAGTGACVPPYFLFQLRVDMPLANR
jgi:hypothetical protein